MLCLDELFYVLPRQPARRSAAMTACIREELETLTRKVCRDNGLAYYHGPRTIAYTACVLFLRVAMRSALAPRLGQVWVKRIKRKTIRTKKL